MGLQTATRKTARKKKKMRIYLGISAAVIFLGIASAYTAYLYQKVKAWEQIIYPGVSIEGLDMSGKTPEEAKNLLKTKYGDVVLKKKIDITTSKKTYSIDYSNLNAKYNIDQIVDEAFSYGKNLSKLKKYNLIKAPVEQKYQLSFAYDGKYVKDTIQLMEKEINKKPVPAQLEMISSGKFKVSPDEKGYKLNSEQLEKEILSKINGELGDNLIIKAPIDELISDTTAAKLSSIDTKLTSFTTSYQTSSNERAYNVELATKAINGTLLMPGETFSFNDIVGERTEERGYKEAPVIIGNKIESGLGGGICQVSSTLYNAILRTSLKSTERIHHTLPSSYVPLGLDATVDWGNIDYKFKNTFDYPIYIEGYCQNRNVYFNLYSNSNLNKRTYSVTSEVYETLNATVKTIDDPTLPLGQTVIEQKALNGFKVKVTRNAYENATLVGSEVITNDTYQPVEGIIKKGTKK